MFVYFHNPGTPVPRRVFHPAQVSFPVLQVNSSPNHSAMFKILPGSVRRADIREIFEGTNFKPRPPAGSPTVEARMN